eukprot:scaffold763_cov202-Alexandrium_tamarense.AAC.9
MLSLQHIRELLQRTQLDGKLVLLKKSTLHIRLGELCRGCSFTRRAAPDFYDVSPRIIFVYQSSKPKVK